MSAAERLRAVADLIDAHPDLPNPYVSAFSHKETVDVNWYLTIGKRSVFEQRDAATRIIRDLGGRWQKEESGDNFRFVSNRGPLELVVLVKREAVCERVVVGTETVTLPAEPAEPAQPAKPEQTVEREIVEWRCDSLLRPEPVKEAP